MRDPEENYFRESGVETEKEKNNDFFRGAISVLNFSATTKN